MVWFESPFSVLDTDEVGLAGEAVTLDGVREHVYELAGGKRNGRHADREARA